MRSIFIIAKNTFRLEIRDKILYGIIIFALLYIGAQLFLADLVFKELPMVKGFGLAGIYFFNAVVALFLGTTSFFKDVDRKIVYFILSKPVSRAQFLLGKFFGLCLVVLLATVVLAAAYLGLVFYISGSFDWAGVLAILMQCLEMALFLAFAIFVSTFSSSLLSIVFTSSAFFVGHIVSAMLADAKAMGITGIKYRLVEIIYYVFPNLEKFDIRNFAVHNVPISPVSLALAFAYAFLYVVLLLAAAIWIFDKKEI